jgi:hypothetical protein
MRFRGNEVSRKKGRRLFSRRPNDNPPPHSHYFPARRSGTFSGCPGPSRAADLVPLELVQTTPGTTTRPPSAILLTKVIATSSAPPGLQTRAGGCSVPSALKRMSSTLISSSSSVRRAEERRGDAPYVDVRFAVCSVQRALYITRTASLNATAHWQHPTRIRSRCYRCRWPQPLCCTCDIRDPGHRELVP